MEDKRTALQLLLDLVLGVASSFLRGVGAGIELAQHPLPSTANTLADLGKDSLRRRAGSVTEVCVLLAYKCPQLIDI